MPRTPRPPTDWQWKFRARLDRQVDGDTVWLQMDLGLHVTLTIDIRIADINAPEKDTPEGVAASTAAQAWLEATARAASEADRPWPLLVLTRRTEGRGRWLGKISPIAGGESLSEYLLRTGHATPAYVGQSGV